MIIVPKSLCLFVEEKDWLIEICAILTAEETNFRTSANVTMISVKNKNIKEWYKIILLKRNQNYFKRQLDNNLLNKFRKKMMISLFTDLLEKYKNFKRKNLFNKYALNVQEYIDQFVEVMELSTTMNVCANVKEPVENLLKEDVMEIVLNVKEEYNWSVLQQELRLIIFAFWNVRVNLLPTSDLVEHQMKKIDKMRTIILLNLINFWLLRVLLDNQIVKSKISHKILLKISFNKALYKFHNLLIISMEVICMTLEEVKKSDKVDQPIQLKIINKIVPNNKLYSIITKVC